MSLSHVRGITLPRGEGWIFFSLVLAIVAIGEALKVFRTPALLLIVLVAAIYARQTMLRRQYIPLLLFSAWTLVYVILSYFHAFPAAWTRFHDNGVIFQQASFVALLLPLAAASQKWWEDSRFDRHRELFLITVVAVAFIAGPGFDLAFGIENLFDRPFVTMRSYLLVSLLALSYLAFRSKRWRVPAIFVLVFLFGWSVSHPLYLQNTLVYLILIGFLSAAVLRIPADRLMLGIFIVLLAGATIYGLQDPLSVFTIDPNTGWRLAWWKDALDATAQTGGAGVGFGTESLRNEYGALLERDSYRDEGGTFLLVGTHSAFFDTLLRTGFVGLFLFGLVLFRCVPPARMSARARAHCCAIFAIMTLCLHSNLGLQSPMYSIGVAICIGYLQSERRKALAGATATTMDSTGDVALYNTPLAPQSVRNRY